MAKKRNESIDIAKGIGILLVVLGHTMSPVMEGHHLIEWLYRVIYTFHMPLFFFVSGFVASKLVTKPLKKSTLLKQRTIRLMIPYCVWALIYLPMKIIMSEHVRFSNEYKWYSFFLGNNPDGQLWFLYVVFVISVFMIFCVTKNNITLFTVLFMLASVFAPLIPFSIGFTSITLSFSLYQVGFFFLGTLISTKYDYYKVTKSSALFVVSVIALVTYSVILYIKQDEVWYLQTVTATFAIYICLYLSNILSKFKIRKPISYLGRKSMEIYLIHGPLLVVGRIILPKFISNTYIYILALTIVSVLISVFVAMVINKIKLARLLLFGSK